MDNKQTDGKHFSFDPTINLGHVLTFVGFLVAGFAAYSALDKRVALVEVRSGAMEQRISEQDARTNSALSEIKRDVKDTNYMMHKLLQNGRAP